MTHRLATHPSILAMSGSLRRESYNGAALRAAAGLAPRGVRVRFDDRYRFLPQFNPDLEWRLPRSVGGFRLACRSAVGVLLAIPEYAHGVPGVFKNALDWTVSDGSLDGKPVAVINVAPVGRGGYVQAALAEILGALGADVRFHALPLSRRLPAEAQLRGPQQTAQLRAIIADLVSVSVPMDGAG